MPVCTDASAVSPAPRSPWLIYVLLAAMMFFEYAIWGAWMPVLSGTLAERGVAPVQIGAVYSAFWLACILSPVIGGQLVDRFMPGSWFLALTQFLAAGVAWWTAQQTSIQSLTAGMFVWSLLFAPSLGITNSIAFSQIEKHATHQAAQERIFALIRTLGSIGWIAAAFLRLGLIPLAHLNPSGKTGAISELVLSSLLGLCMAVFVLFLPSSPPKATAGTTKERPADPLAFRRAFLMFKTVPGFTTFLLISFIAATEFQFFYLLSAPFLQDLSIPNQYVPVVKSISQVTEMAALFVLLPLWLPKKGMKWCLLVGSLAWPLRYFIFALQKPVWLVVLSLGLHGFGYAFVLVVQQLYVDRVAPRDIRASAQSLLTLVTLGLGNFLGTIFCSMVQQAFTTGGKTNWPPVFILPAVLTLLCAFAYAKTFREPLEVSAQPLSA